MLPLRGADSCDGALIYADPSEVTRDERQVRVFVSLAVKAELNYTPRRALEGFKAPPLVMLEVLIVFERLRGSVGEGDRTSVKGGGLTLRSPWKVSACGKASEVFGPTRAPLSL
jgi:hypothetical protein